MPTDPNDYAVWVAVIAAMAIALFVALRGGKAGAPPPPEAPIERGPAAPLAEPATPVSPIPPAPQPPGPLAAGLAEPPEERGPYLVAPIGEPDNLQQIKGIGPKLAARLAELGVFHYAQIAAWTPDELATVDAELGQFRGRPERDRWQEQARLLATGDTRAFERAHGKLGPPAGPAA
jgi:predicted flap endonuclease-1-like 5' DNA nuclease